MQTQKLYYEDCHLYEFTARVVDCRAQGEAFEVILDATAFYPEGGGQACDIGTLGIARVTDVREKTGEIVHLCSQPLPIGETVAGKIDAARRFDLMQQHSGEHIVSGIIFQKYGYHNVGFHVGADVMTIDFDGEIPADDLSGLEQAANQAVWRNLAIRCWYPEPEELKTLAYRSKKALEGAVRIVEIPGVDVCACCGVHVAATGEIGLIKLLSVCKFHQGVRMTMLCGGRALEMTQAVFTQNRLVSQAFSAKPLETGAAAQRMNELLANERLRAGALERRIFDTIAQGYAGRGDTLHFEDALSGNALRQLAQSIAQSCGGVAAVFSDDHFCLAGPSERVREVALRLRDGLNAKGGGKAGIFQGSVQAEREQIRKLMAQCGVS